MTKPHENAFRGLSLCAASRFPMTRAFLFLVVTPSPYLGAAVSRHDPESGFKTVMDLKFIEDISDVGFNRLVADENFFANLFVRQTFGHQVQDLQFSLRQGLDGVVGRRTQVERLAPCDAFEIGTAW